MRHEYSQYLSYPWTRYWVSHDNGYSLHIHAVTLDLSYPSKPHPDTTDLI